MSDAFARCFLLVFGQLAVGGFLSLAAPPFHELHRGFYHLMHFLAEKG